jgi:hypothetical protein
MRSCRAAEDRDCYGLQSWRNPAVSGSLRCAMGSTMSLCFGVPWLGPRAGWLAEVPIRHSDGLEI